MKASLGIGSLAASIALLFTLATAAGADAAPTYRDPPAYEGVEKAPKTEPPSFPTTSLSGAGTFPDVLVDEAGTGHIVWNEGRGDAADVAVYCRLKRGATSCDKRHELTWDKTYGAGDGPQFNIDDGGPRIVRIGDQLLVLSKRYPTIGEKPDGASSSTVVGWVSNDGGTSWSAAQVLGKRNLGQLAVAGPADNPVIVDLGHDPFCGGMCVTSYVSGVYSTAEGVLNTDPNSNYNATLERDGAGLIGAFSDLQPRIWLRRWNGSGSPTDPGELVDLGAAARGRARARRRAGGPVPDAEAGLLRPPAGATPVGRRPGKVVAGPAVPITGAAGARFGRLHEDASGRLLAAWQQDGSGVQLRTSKAGASGFEPAQRLIGGDGNGQIELDAYRDGGGFSVLNHTGGVNSPGADRRRRVRQPGGDRPARDRRPSRGRRRRHLPAGRLRQRRGQDRRGLLPEGDRRQLRRRRHLRRDHAARPPIVPDPGARHRARSEGADDRHDRAGAGARRQRIDRGRALPRGAAPRPLGPAARLAPVRVPAGEFQANVFGFDVAAGLPVILTENGVRIPIDVELPSAFGGFTGHAELTAPRRAAGSSSTASRSTSARCRSACSSSSRSTSTSRAGGPGAGPGSSRCARGRLDRRELRLRRRRVRRRRLRLHARRRRRRSGRSSTCSRSAATSRCDRRRSPLARRSEPAPRSRARLRSRSTGEFTMTFPTPARPRSRSTARSAVHRPGRPAASCVFETDGYAHLRRRRRGSSLGPLSRRRRRSTASSTAATGSSGPTSRATRTICMEVERRIRPGRSASAVASAPMPRLQHRLRRLRADQPTRPARRFQRRSRAALGRAQPGRAREPDRRDRPADRGDRDPLPHADYRIPPPRPASRRPSAAEGLAVASTAGCPARRFWSRARQVRPT